MCEIVLPSVKHNASMFILGKYEHAINALKSMGI